MVSEALFLDVIDRIYALALADEDQWSHALSGLSELLGGVCVSFEVINKRTGQPDFFRLAGDFDETKSAQYLPYYAGISPRVQSACKPMHGNISYDYQILSEEEINRDEYYNDFAMPQGMRYFVAGHVLDSDSHLCLFAVQRSQASGHVQGPDLELTERLIPHVRRALDLKFRLAQGQGLRAGLEQYLNSLAEAVFLLDIRGGVVFRNAFAESLLQRQGALRCTNNTLAFSDSGAGANFLRGLAEITRREIASGGQCHQDFVIRRQGILRPYLASLRSVCGGLLEEVVPESVVGMLLVRDPEYFSALNKGLLQESYGLSAQELELAIALDQGLSLQEVARKREVASTTVRTQLYSLMAKLGIRRQQDLLRLLSQYRQPFL